MKKPTHIDIQGSTRMVDVSSKSRIRRTAVAKGEIRLLPETIRLLRNNTLIALVRKSKETP